jgi:hypothetical protein
MRKDGKLAAEVEGKLVEEQLRLAGEQKSGGRSARASIRRNLAVTI